jgi:hypothetical protein
MYWYRHAIVLRFAFSCAGNVCLLIDHKNSKQETQLFYWIIWLNLYGRIMENWCALASDDQQVIGLSNCSLLFFNLLIQRWLISVPPSKLRCSHSHLDSTVLSLQCKNRLNHWHSQQWRQTFAVATAANASAASAAANVGGDGAPPPPPQPRR